MNTQSIVLLLISSLVLALPKKNSTYHPSERKVIELKAAIKVRPTLNDYEDIEVNDQIFDRAHSQGASSI